MIASAYAPYVGSSHSDVYHYTSCRYVNMISHSNLVYFQTPLDARQSGYRPCKVCRPPYNY
ncbi:MAG: hypothetical protein HC898_06450 [Phycisphaerales bacterium]|nr:hypothetical protein [Phycisphaerales bacterium]